jgi:hypothetical protein
MEWNAECMAQYHTASQSNKNGLQSTMKLAGQHITPMSLDVKLELNIVFKT